MGAARMQKDAQICTIFETTFFHAAPVLAGLGRTAQSAQKEVGLTRRRGGGASARKGGQAGGHILRHSPHVGRSC